MDFDRGTYAIDPKEDGSWEILYVLGMHGDDGRRTVLAACFREAGNPTYCLALTDGADKPLKHVVHIDEAQVDFLLRIVNG